jgi:hypothetical protein
MPAYTPPGVVRLKLASGKIPKVTTSLRQQKALSIQKVKRFVVV